MNINVEDRINALLTKDPNKIGIYTKGYDGHCLRAYSYYSEMMPDIDPNSVDSINSIAEKYPKLRSRSKAPSFGLAYGGTSYTMVKNLGFSEEEAKKIEANYHKLYRVSDLHAEAVTIQAIKDGYIELAFGLKLRCPTLSKVTFPIGRLTPQESAESRTINNAESQSYGMLTNRAAIELEQRLKASPYKNKILVMNIIHDALYYLVKDEPEVVKWLNDNLIACMKWNEAEPIKSTEVPMAAELDVGYSWDNQKTIHNDASLEEVSQFLKELHNERDNSNQQN